MFGNEYLDIMVSSAVVYLFIILAIRISGRKELAQLSVIDLVFILLISNAVQNAMVGANTTLVGGLLAAGTLFVLNFALKTLMHRHARFSKFIQGEEIMLVYKGVVNKGNLSKAKLSMDELLEAVREHGIASVKDVNLAVLEVDGNISVLSDDYKTRTSFRNQRPPKIANKRDA
jgi:uncharacterized membrane protein YcaP (DUF421 family)